MNGQDDQLQTYTLMNVHNSLLDKLGNQSLHAELRNILSITTNHEGLSSDRGQECGSEKHSCSPEPQQQLYALSCDV